MRLSPFLPVPFFTCPQGAFGIAPHRALRSRQEQEYSLIRYHPLKGNRSIDSESVS
jgi:hypothetical protein